MENKIMTAAEWLTERDKIVSDAEVVIKSGKIVGGDCALMQEYAEYYHNEKSKWIGTDVQTPKDRIDCNLLLSTGDVRFGYYSQTDQEYRIYGDIPDDWITPDKIKAWQPAPLAPNKQK